jgi:hypothetical protein
MLDRLFKLPNHAVKHRINRNGYFNQEKSRFSTRQDFVRGRVDFSLSCVFPGGTSELHIYLERELESKKWSQLRVNRAVKTIEKDWNWGAVAPSTWISWGKWYKSCLRLGLARVGRMTEVLAPDIYGAHWVELMDQSHINQNFELNKSRQNFHYSLKEHHKISNIPKFRCKML